MTINLDPAQASVASVRLDRQHANARQESWMAHLQDALFGTQGTNVLLPARARSEGNARQPADPPARDHVRRDTEMRAAADPAASGMAPQALPSALAPQEPVGESSPAMGIAAGPDGAVAASMQPGAPVAAEPALVAAARMHGAPTMMFGAQPVQSWSPTSAVTAAMSAARPAMPSTAEPQAPAAPVAECPSLAPLQSFAPLVDAGTDVPAAQAKDKAGALSAAGEAEEYAQRHLHIYQDGGGVQAWVRDASLTPAQIAAVAHALAGQFAADGRPLSALTVNGRKAAVPQGARDSTLFAATLAVAALTSKGQ